MAAIDRKEANVKKLKEANAIQDRTEAAISRIQRQTAEAEELGAQTLDELRRQGKQMDEVNTELEFVGAKLTTSKALQSKFDAWAGNWLGRKRRAAMKKAAAEIQDMNKEEHSRIKEVFQHEKYNFIARSWKPLDMVLCADPSVNCDDLFDPVVAEHNAGSHWIVDNSLAGIDQNGWTYAYDVKTLNQTGSGNPFPQWNSLVRRRKWRYVERASVSSASGVKGIVARSDARAVKLAANNKPMDKIGYVPRNKQAAGMSASGLSSVGMMGKNRNDPDQVLDEDASAGLSRVEERNSEIDAGIDTISRGIDNLASIGAAMKDEIISQNQKLEKIGTRMQKDTEKQTVVNAYQRSLVKHA
eukprot:gene18945-21553_t